MSLSISEQGYETAKVWAVHVRHAIFSQGAGLLKCAGCGREWWLDRISGIRDFLPACSARDGQGAYDREVYAAAYRHGLEPEHVAAWAEQHHAMNALQLFADRPNFKSMVVFNRDPRLDYL